MLQRKQDIYHRGFTLIEIIITLIVASLLGVMLYTIILSSGKQATFGIINYQKYESLGRAMESLDAYYRSLLDKDPNKISKLFDYFNEDKINEIVKAVDSDIIVETKYILFDENGHEKEDDSEKRILKVILRKDNISLVNLFAK